MVNVLDENGVRQLAQGIKDNCKKWVKDTRRRKQIIIGRAIRPESAYCLDVENWYAFIENPHIYEDRCLDKNKPYRIYIKNIDEKDYEEKECLFCDKTTMRYFRCDYPIMCKVDYLDRIARPIKIYLTYKYAPKTLKGTSLRQEWQGGKHVNNKKLDIRTIPQFGIRIVIKKFGSLTNILYLYR